MAEAIDSKVRNIMNQTDDVIKLVDYYISSNENWMFYFMSPFLTKRGNPFGALFDVMEDYPEDWKDRISFEVRNIARSSVAINIYIDNGTETPTTLHGNILLVNFERDAKNNFEAQKIDIRERRKKDLLETKENLEHRLKEIENELEDITKEEVKESKHE
jgi:hypothetical protein